MMGADEAPSQPSLPWRAGSSFTMGAVGFLCRTFLVGLNKLEVNGLERFQELLAEREDVEGRTRGLITGKSGLQHGKLNGLIVRNSFESRQRVRTYMRQLAQRSTKLLRPTVDVFRSLDDPLIWGVLPYLSHWRPDNLRWSLASHDLAFKNKFVPPLVKMFPPSHAV